MWIFEGITSYYDDLALLRSGLINTDSYLELLSRTLAAVYRSQGRRRQTLEDASFDAWIKFYRPDENTPNAQVSYYSKGAIVALALDLEIRLRTEGRSSLDQVMRLLGDTPGREAGPGLPEGAFEELVAEATGLDLSEFFRSNVRGTVDPPFGILRAQFGIRLHLRVAEGHADAGGVPAQRKGATGSRLGLRWRGANGRVRVVHVATVYRVLTQFEQAGLLARNHFEGGRAMFELNEGSHHDHLVCLTCGGVEEFVDSEIERRQHSIAAERGFKLQDHALALYGECTKPDCEFRRKE